MNESMDGERKFVLCGDVMLITGLVQNGHSS